MPTKNNNFTLNSFFFLVLAVNVIAAALFYWLGAPSEQAVTVNHTEIVVTASILLISFAACACIGIAAYVAQPRVQW